MKSHLQVLGVRTTTLNFGGTQFNLEHLQSSEDCEEGNGGRCDLGKEDCICDTCNLKRGTLGKIEVTIPLISKSTSSYEKTECS